MREIRMLRAMWRALETEPRRILNGHEGGNAGYSQGVAYGSPRQCSTLPNRENRASWCSAPNNRFELSILWDAILDFSA